MASVFPGALDTLANPSSSTAMDATGYEHDVVHTNANNAVLAVERALKTTFHPFLLMGC